MKKLRLEVGPLLLLSLLGQQDGLDVRQDATLGDGNARQELVEFLVVADGKLEMAGDDTGLLIITGSIAGQFENFGSQVLHDGGQIDRGSSTNALGVVALAEKTVDSTYGELKTSPAGAGL